MGWPAIIAVLRGLGMVASKKKCPECSINTHRLRKFHSAKAAYSVAIDVVNPRSSRGTAVAAPSRPANCAAARDDAQTAAWPTIPGKCAQDGAHRHRPGRD